MILVFRIISEVTLITYTLFIWIYFFSVPSLVEFHLIYIGLTSISPFYVSLDFILVIFSERLSPKLNYFSDWNCNCFLLELSTIPPLICCDVISLFVLSTLLSELMSMNQLMFPISSISLSADFYSWVIIIIVGLYHSASIAISHARRYKCFNRDYPIFVFVLPPLEPLWSNHAPGHDKKCSYYFLICSTKVAYQAYDPNTFYTKRIVFLPLYVFLRGISSLNVYVMDPKIL